MKLGVIIDKFESDGRPSREDVFMCIAHCMSWRGSCRRKQVGAIITTQSHRIVSSGYNGTLRGDLHCNKLGCNLEEKCKHAVHAELNAIAFAAQAGVSLFNTILYCTTAPCYECAKVIVQVGISKVIYGGEYTDTLGIDLLIKHGVKCQDIKSLRPWLKSES